MKAIVAVSLLLLITLIGSTVWATSKSRERTACYYRTHDVNECAGPNLFERLIRRSVK